MNANNHIIVGEPRRCLCGIYDGKAVGCQDLLHTMSLLRARSAFEADPQRYYATTGNESEPPRPDAHSLIVLMRVFDSLVQDCPPVG